jgi:ribosome-associated toxin RatA of RatAB toxin-antitoxin module
MSRGVLWCAVALLTLAGAARAAEDWQRHPDQDGMVIESRPVDGTAMREVRVTTHDPLPPARIMATLWRQDEYPQFVESFAQVDVLRDDGDTKLVYERIHVPFGDPRDMTLRITRTFAAPPGVWEVISTAVPDEGPPPSPGCVRVRASRSVWRLVPGADGGTDVSYAIRTDAGGRLPGWIVAWIQKNAAAKFVRAILDRARSRG